MVSRGGSCLLRPRRRPLNRSKRAIWCGALAGASPSYVPPRPAPLRCRSRLRRNVTMCMHGGVATVSIPQRGGSKTPQRRDRERSAAFKQGQRFRAGIEGRISVLMRGRGMKRSVAAAVLANNLMIIGELLSKRSTRRRKTNQQFLN
jgi:hypothetical protein